MPHMLIHGAQVPAASGRTFRVHNPATEEVLDAVPQADVEDARRAIAAANDSLPQWRRTTAHAKADHAADLHFTVSYRQPKLIAIDKQPDDNVMHLGRSGIADRLAG
jgi:acyl-CoA reductase-like NAD-dependent aldehyde dehydrogenase